MISRSMILSIMLLASPLLSVVWPGVQSRAQAQTLSQQPSPQKKPPQDPEQDEVIRLSSRLVLVPVSVSDASGRPVPGLTAEDFVIEEAGQPQQIVSLGEPGKTPVEIVLLFDTSSSIHGQFAFEQQAAVRFVKEVLKPDDAVSLFSIGVTPKILMDRVTSSDRAIRGILSIEPKKGATAFFDAVAQASLYLGRTAEAGSRRVLVVISDGEENYSKHNKLDDALRELQKNDCLFYSINPSGPGIVLNRVSLKGQSFMEAMSSQTGGQAFIPDRIEELESVFRQIAEELQTQYLFGYYSTEERDVGEFKKITVRAPNRPDLRIRARQGYYVSRL